MKVKMFVAAIALTLAPGMAMAMCGWERSQTASQCEQGTTWDSETQTCIAPVSS